MWMLQNISSKHIQLLLILFLVCFSACARLTMHTITIQSETVGLANPVFMYTLNTIRTIKKNIILCRRSNISE